MRAQARRESEWSVPALRPAFPLRRRFEIPSPAGCETGLTVHLPRPPDAAAAP